MVALTVGDLVTVRPMSQKTIARQMEWQQRDRQAVAPGVIIRQPFNYIGVAMTVEELHRDSAYCQVHDLRVRVKIMGGKAVAEIPRKYLKRVKGT